MVILTGFGATYYSLAQSCVLQYGHFIGSIHAVAWSLNDKAYLYPEGWRFEGRDEKMADNCDVHLHCADH